METCKQLNKQEFTTKVADIEKFEGANGNSWVSVPP